MGVYDMVNGIQVKATADPCMHNYKVGEHIDLADGAYLCFEGVFIVHEGRIVGSSEHAFDKWGNTIKLYDLLNPNNPVRQAIQNLEGELKQK